MQREPKERRDQSSEAIGVRVFDDTIQEEGLNQREKAEVLAF